MPTTTHHYQLILPHSPERVFRAWTDAQELEAWFCEHARVSLADKRYDFWGKYTPESPSEEDGTNAIHAIEPPTHLVFGWHLRGGDTRVELRLAPRDGGTVLGVWHRDVPEGKGESPLADFSIEDVWFLTLENLRRHLAGRPPLRKDHSAMLRGDVRHSVEIAGSRTEVWRALTDPRQLERWIASDSRVELEPGGAWSLGWGDYDTFKILDLVEGERLEIEWNVGEQASVVTWTLEGSGGRTRLTITHSGFGPDEPTAGVQVGWLQYLNALASLIEFGKDWYPVLKELTAASGTLYAAAILAKQEVLERWKDR